MSFGVVMLVHMSLDRAAQVAAHWLDHGKPVVIHIDKRVSDEDASRLRDKLADYDQVRFSDRQACDWGRWSIVAVTQDSCATMLDEFPQVDRVLLASGSCLPLRPVAELQAYLDKHQGVDFIESVTKGDFSWIVGGLDSERFTLRFPFSWQRSRRLFDQYVNLQRWVRFRRKIPAGISPHLGSQWWCLTRKTLSAILNDPEGPVFDKYFRHVWIPDESYFQSLVRRHSDAIENRSLTFAKFDFQGRPHVFYDDHQELLRRSRCFLARKIWPGADTLYDVFLTQADQADDISEPQPLVIGELFDEISKWRLSGRPGLYMQGRFPNAGQSSAKTNRPYLVLYGFDRLFSDIQHDVARRTELLTHGRLFAADKAHFAGALDIVRGALTSSAKQRDYNPGAFVTNLIWNMRETPQCFLLEPDDQQKVGKFLASDENAMISIITGSWAIQLFQSSADFEGLLTRAQKFQQDEAALIALLQSPKAKAQVKIWSLAEFLNDTAQSLQSVFEGSADYDGNLPTPKTADFTGFSKFLRQLENAGLDTGLIGDFTDPDIGQNSGAN